VRLSGDDTWGSTAGGLRPVSLRSVPVRSAEVAGDLVADVVGGEARLGDDPHPGPRARADQAEQDVLGADAFVLQPQGLPQ
jgi:hypothetical protein